MEKAIGFFEMKGKRDLGVKSRVECAINWLWQIAKSAGRNYRSELSNIYFDFDAQLLVATDGRILGMFHVPPKSILDGINQSCYLRVSGKSVIALEATKTYVTYQRVIPNRKEMIKGSVKTIDYGEEQINTSFLLEKERFNHEVPVLYKALPNVVDLMYITMLKGYVWEFYYSPDYKSGRAILFSENYPNPEEFGQAEAVVMPMAYPFVDQDNPEIVGSKE